VNYLSAGRFVHISKIEREAWRGKRKGEVKGGEQSGEGGKEKKTRKGHDYGKAAWKRVLGKSMREGGLKRENREKMSQVVQGTLQTKTTF